MITTTYSNSDYEPRIGPSYSQTFNIDQEPPRGSQDVRIVKFSKFSIGYSDSLQMPIWASYDLTRYMVKTKAKLRRKTKPYNSPGARKEQDFIGSDYDRGHMVPFSAMHHNKKAGYETFSMYNIVPQIPFLNRSIWKVLENQAQSMALKYGCVTVLINNDFEGEVVTTARGISLPVPTKQTMIVTDCDGEILFETTTSNENFKI